VSRNSALKSTLQMPIQAIGGKRSVQLFAAVGGACFLLICVVGGGRLLLLARRTRQLPEFVLGLGLFLMGGIGTPASALARAPIEMSAATRALLMIGQGVILATGYGAFTLFTQRVFRPCERWAVLLAWALPGAVLASIAVMALEPDGVALATGRQPGLSVGYFGQQVLGTLILAWTAWEALRYTAALRRRLQLGLADAVVTDRMRLWGSAMALSAAMASIMTIGSALGIDLMATMPGLALFAGLGVVAAGAIYLAFLPPRIYTDWVSARAQRG
jgi:hypothetical protein